MTLHPIETAIVAAVDELSDALFVGYSGGLDSTALLLAAHAVRPDVIAIHANHQLHAAADAWQVHCEAQCQRLGVTLHARRLQVAPGNLEAQARAARYAFFAEVVGSGMLLLGHHADDYTETALLRLVQGRGLMSMEARGNVGRGRFLRPLLRFSKDDLAAYLDTRGAAWVEDASNRDDRFDRNYLRHEVIPSLQARWPALSQSIARSARTAMASSKVLRAEMANKPNAIDALELPQASDERLEWLRAFLASRGVFNIGDKAIFEFARQLLSANTCELDIGEGLLGGYKGRIHFEAKRPQPGPLVTALSAGDRIDLGWAELRIHAAQATDVCAFGCAGDLRLDYRHGGESIRISGRGKLGLKELLGNAGVPPWRRAAYPLIFAHDELVCVPGIAAAVVGEPALWCTAELVEI